MSKHSDTHSTYLSQISSAEKWDAIYAAKIQAAPRKPISPCWLLQQHSRHLPLSGRGLDLACGLGGNARFMAQCGLSVEAWDISDVALTELNNWAAVNQFKIQPLLTDFEQMLFPYQQFDVIVVSRYLNRQLFPQLEQALKPGGKIFYQTFLAPVQENAPSNPDFYIQTGEFNQVWPNLKTLVYGEGHLSAEEQGEAENKQRHRYAWYIGQKG